MHPCKEVCKSHVHTVRTFSTELTPIPDHSQLHCIYASENHEYKRIVFGEPISIFRPCFSEPLARPIENASRSVDGSAILRTLGDVHVPCLPLQIP